MKDLKLLADLCKGDVALFINEHRSDYQSIEEYFISNSYMDLDIAGSRKKEIIEKDFFVQLIVYPDTPVGSYSIYHYDIDLAIKEALDIVINSVQKEVIEEMINET